MSTAVDEQDSLLFIYLQLPQRLLQRAAKHTAISLLQFLAHIHNFDWWQWAGFDAGGEGEIVKMIG